LKERFAALTGQCSAVLALIAASPVLAASCAAIWLDDGAPLLFRQRRVGQHGKTFNVLKLRTMFTGNSGALITQAGDQRITRVGRFLRRYKLDELPQLWNVVRGEMCWIGPRPEVPAYVDASAADWQGVLKLKPGITDLATLLFRDEEKMVSQARDVEQEYRNKILPAKLALNLRYARSRTWFSDLKLLLLTVRYSFVPDGFDADRISRAILGTNAACSRASQPERVPHA